MKTGMSSVIQYIHRIGEGCPLQVVRKFSTTAARSTSPRLGDMPLLLLILIVVTLLHEIFATRYFREFHDLKKIAKFK